MAEAQSYSQSRHDNLATEKSIEEVEITRTKLILNICRA
jgi:hypothetical protein